MRESLFTTYSHLAGHFAGNAGGTVGGDDDAALKDSGFDDGTFYPYVNIEL